MRRRYAEAEQRGNRHSGSRQYLTGAVVALGVARVAMGVRLFAAGIWLSWLILRTRQRD